MLVCLTPIKESTYVILRGWTGWKTRPVSFKPWSRAHMSRSWIVTSSAWKTWSTESFWSVWTLQKSRNSFEICWNLEKWDIIGSSCPNCWTRKFPQEVFLFCWIRASRAEVCSIVTLYEIEPPELSKFLNALGAETLLMATDWWVFVMELNVDFRQTNPYLST